MQPLTTLTLIHRNILHSALCPISADTQEVLHTSKTKLSSHRCRSLRVVHNVSITLRLHSCSRTHMDHRLVSPIEMYSVARHNLDLYKCVTLNLRFQAASFSLTEWTSRIERSLRFTIDAHPRLRLQVDLSRKQALFVRLPMTVFETLPMRVVHRTSRDDADEACLMETLENESNTSFTYDRCSPLWRVVLIVASDSDIFDLVVSFNHAIADGISGMAFWTSFVEGLSGKSTVTYSLEDDLPSYQLLPSSLPPIRSLILQVIEKLLLPSVLSKYFFPKTYWTGDIRPTGLESNRTRLVSLDLPSSAMELLHKKCHVERTTIHGALFAALLLSTAEIFGKGGMEFFCSTAVNVRSFCHPVVSNRQMGVFVSSADSSHHIPAGRDLIEQFWPLARQIKEQITREIAQSTLPMIQSLKFVSDWDKLLVEQRKTLPNGCAYSVDMSNLLRWSLESDDPSWRILHGGFTQSASMVGSVLSASVLTLNGVLKVNICFQESRFDSIDKVKQMKDRMRAYLMQVVSYEGEETVSDET